MTQVLSHPVNYMDRPFGFEFFGQEGHDEPAPPPEPPAPGRPLLDESDTNLNNQLFSNLEDPRLLESLNQYQAEPAPNLFGTSSHFGHPEIDLGRAFGLFHPGQRYQIGPLSAPAHLANFPQHVNPNAPFENAPLPQHQISHNRTQSGTFGKNPHEAEVDQQLLHHHHQQQQQHHHHQQQHQQHQQQQQLQQQQQQQQQQQNPHLHQQQQPELASQHQQQRQQQQRKAALGGSIYNHAARNMLKEGREARPDSYLERRMTFTYGSDTGFKGNSYTPPAHVLTHSQTLEAQKMGMVHNGYKAPFNRVSRPSSSSGWENEPQSATSVVLEGIADDEEDDAGQEGQRKRRRLDEQEDENSESTSVTPTPHRKKIKASGSTSVPGSQRALAEARGSGTPTASGAGSTLKKSADSKTARINLTEEEKKMNHIRSEQKRRNQIKEGFADLTDMMPDAASAGPSKCTILAKAVDWLSGLIEGNKQLKQQLVEMGVSI